MVDYALESGGMCCLHYFALSWSLHWLGPKCARQHSAKHTGLGTSTNQTPNLDSQPRLGLAEGRHGVLSGSLAGRNPVSLG